MRNILILLLVLGINGQVMAQKSLGELEALNYRIYYGKGLKDGWYEATVKYSNSNTYTRSTYTLHVEVSSNRVIKIDFGDGGSVHSGINNSNYYYSGGFLNFQYDLDRNIIGATTRVTVQRGNTHLTYDIDL